MELRQLRYFVRIVELGSMGRAALDLEMVQSALSQQVSRLEGELSTRLLRRTSRGVVATEAGVAFFREAQLTLRHADQAVRVARQARLSGTVSVGLAPTTAAMLGLPLMRAMRERYPDVRLHLVEGLSGHLAAMLNSRTLDMAILFDRRTPAGPGEPGRRLWQIQPLMDEDIFLICARERCMRPGKIPSTLTLNDIAQEPLILPTGPHGLRSTLDAAFARSGVVPNVVLEVDSLSMLMAAVDAGLGGTLQPRAAVGRFPDADQRFQWARIDENEVRRTNTLCSLPEAELSSAAIATRMVISDAVRALIENGSWPGVTPRMPSRK
ncbi:LysR substrate-binding domain-containing protein [Verminephrobacter eiseniae]|uniref:LysR substrate-binding domain-containing protein n=1 Tax=Verminephrobacter eiseniae TaxID=364317 RepID=UPI00223813E7|nr:LysR substrate-binding domain-containing protein [Verminephrobacter eiseniae]MCW5229892.1 LysR family transcriptional regulator [Verminephrobacter eiseniae]MCW5291624.1 LysR family transcriptional regulator [Verminephrobacter eiseniae]MCW8184721.1 LysR family transcriptional regulator [Verminephrobacter eiseniae]MCW8223560.1 LysR family transcriptional regulator [Verminephrobacter eiseniae]MCW8234591.1 LysR family transcriptional regulator [Verminephrobacter eiseniae]